MQASPLVILLVLVLPMALNLLLSRTRNSWPFSRHTFVSSSLALVNQIQAQSQLLKLNVPTPSSLPTHTTPQPLLSPLALGPHETSHPSLSPQCTQSLSATNEFEPDAPAEIASPRSCQTTRANAHRQSCGQLLLSHRTDTRRPQAKQLLSLAWRIPELGHHVKVFSFLR